jgi:hypothetical protein
VLLFGLLASSAARRIAVTVDIKPDIDTTALHRPNSVEAEEIVGINDGASFNITNVPASGMECPSGIFYLGAIDLMTH